MEDILDTDDNIYNFKNADDYEYKIKKGLNREIVEEISKRKNEPKWLLDIRLKALEIYNQLSLPTWGPDLNELDMDNISTYVKPKSDIKNNWDEVPKDIKDTFTKLGIPKAETDYLAI